MAADTRDASSASSVHPYSSSQSPSATPTPTSPQSYELFIPSDSTPPSASPNAAGAANPAGVHSAELTFGEAAKSIKVEDFKTIHLRPCTRDSLLLGISSAFGVGGIRAVLGGEHLHNRNPCAKGWKTNTDWNGQTAPIPKATNWAVGTFIGAAVISYEVCQYQRRRQQEGMKKAIEIIDKKRMEKEQKVKDARVARRRQREEVERREAENKKRGLRRTTNYELRTTNYELRTTNALSPHRGTVV
ncbi:MAG: hypothetical protein M1833_005020 [Piccolia ochrophora]|nr:MAG: hypothetical protein M1833_005020 [Piccolia ochrophora]